MVAVGLLGRARGHAAAPLLGGPGLAAVAREAARGRGPADRPRAARGGSLPARRPYVVFPALIWAALRFGPRGATARWSSCPALTVWNTAHNAGPFVRESITDSLLSSQLFLATAALTSLVLAAVTAERTRADEALRANEQRLRSVVQSMARGSSSATRRG